jgi:hypothetical protein
MGSDPHVASAFTAAILTQETSTSTLNNLNLRSFACPPTSIFAPWLESPSWR